VAVSD
jgi:hypothetical protein